MTKVHVHNNLFSEVLTTIYSQFQAKHIDADQEVLLNANELNFLGVRMGLQDTYNPKHLRQAVERLLNCKDFRLIQIVGDSSPGFTQPGCEAVKSIIEPLILEPYGVDRHAVVEYGYTASLYDTNWVVNDILTDNPQLGVRTVANVVYASASAVDQWRCKALANVHSFVLAYDHTFTKFGDDTWLSDYTMTAQLDDRLICVEGGPQSFQQMVTVCKRGVSVSLVTGSGLRPDGPSRFSAAQLMKQLYEKWCLLRTERVPLPEVKKALDLVATEYLNGQVDLQPAHNRNKIETILKSLKSLLEDPETIENIRIEPIKW